jgi:hypothetical protein
MIFYFFIAASAFIIKLVVSSTVLYKTDFSEQPLIAVQFDNEIQKIAFDSLIGRVPLSNPTDLVSFCEAARFAIPGILIVTEMKIVNHILSLQNMDQSGKPTEDEDDNDEKRIFTSAVDWVSSSYKCKSYTLPISINSRETFVEDAVRSYKALDRIPFTAPYHLFHRNLLVHFNERPESVGVVENRNLFFQMFFDEALRTNRYFTRNQQGALVISKSDRLYEEDLDFYEAFGFFLAKGFQNASINTKLNIHPQIITAIQIGKTIGIPSKWRVQVTMMTLGFVRACPAYILENISSIVLRTAF